MKKYVSTSELSCWLECRMRWLWSYGLRYQPAKGSKALEIGRLWHRVLEAWWRAWISGYPLDAAHSVLRTWLTERQAGSFSVDRPLPGIGDDIVTDVHWILFRMLEGYNRAYLEQQDGIASTHGDCPHIARVVGVEQRVRLKPDDGLVDYMAVFDAVVEDDNGELWIVEHKTTKGDLERARERHEDSAQVNPYLWVAAKHYGRVPRGIVLDLSRVGAPPAPEDYRVNKDGSMSKRWPAGQTAASLRAALKHHNQEPCEKTSKALSKLDKRPDQYHRREIVSVNRLAVRRSEAEVRHLSSEVMAARRHLLVTAYQHHAHHRADETAKVVASYLREYGAAWPRNRQRCYAYGSRCEYWHACRSLDQTAIDETLRRRPTRR